MIRKELKIEDASHLQSRPAALLVQEACKFASRIWVEQGGKTVNAKSMMGVLSLGSLAEDRLVLVVEGEDEQAAAEAVEPYVAMMYAHG